MATETSAHSGSGRPNVQLSSNRGSITVRRRGPRHPWHEGAPVEDKTLESADVPSDLFLLGRERCPKPEPSGAEPSGERVGLCRDVAGEVGERLEGALVLGLRRRGRR